MNPKHESKTAITSRLITICLALTYFWLAGCASTPLSQEFERVQPGMEKDAVLEIMGAPKVYRRVKTKDIYTYVFYENGVRIEKEIQFEGGRVVYAGNLSEPKESAEAADERIRKENEQAEAEYQRKKEERKKLPQTLEKELKGRPEDAKMPEYREI